VEFPDRLGRAVELIGGDDDLRGRARAAGEVRGQDVLAVAGLGVAEDEFGLGDARGLELRGREQRQGKDDDEPDPDRPRSFRDQRGDPTPYARAADARRGGARLRLEGPEHGPTDGHERGGQERQGGQDRRGEAREALRPRTAGRPMLAEAGRAFGWKGQNTARAMVMSAAGRNVSAARIAMAMPIAATGPRARVEARSVSRRTKRLAMTVPP